MRNLCRQAGEFVADSGSGAVMTIRPPEKPSVCPPPSPRARGSCAALQHCTKPADQGGRGAGTSRRRASSIASGANHRQSGGERGCTTGSAAVAVAADGRVGVVAAATAWRSLEDWRPPVLDMAPDIMETDDCAPARATRASLRRAVPGAAAMSAARAASAAPEALRASPPPPGGVCATGRARAARAPRERSIPCVASRGIPSS